MRKLPSRIRPAATATRATAARQYHALYDHKWRRFRAKWLADHPLCVYCERAGRMTAATVVDHIVPHRGDPGRFWQPGNHQSLCSHCHSGAKQREEQQQG